MGNIHSVRGKDFAEGESGKGARRTFYVSWTPEEADDQLDSDNAFNKFVKKLHEHIGLSPEDSKGRPIEAIALLMKASTKAKDKWKANKGVTDFVFVATWKHAGQQAKMIDDDEYCDLGWYLGLQKKAGGEASEHVGKGDAPPRLWFVPLDMIKPNRFVFTPRGGAKSSINNYHWHLTDPAVNETGDWFEPNHKVTGIEYDPYKRSIVIEVTDEFLDHDKDECDVCKLIGN